MDPKENFPEADAWAASMPDLRDSFAASAPRKVEVGGETIAAADQEFKVFAGLDLSNM